MRPVTGLPSAAAVVAAIHRTAIPRFPGGQVWLPRLVPRPSVQIGGGPAVGSSFGAGARSASRGNPPFNGPHSELLRKLVAAGRWPGSSTSWWTPACLRTQRRLMMTVLKVMGKNRLTEAIELHSRMAAPDACTYTVHTPFQAPFSSRCAPTPVTSGRRAGRLPR